MFEGCAKVAQVNIRLVMMQEYRIFRYSCHIFEVCFVLDEDKRKLVSEGADGIFDPLSFIQATDRAEKTLNPAK